MGTETNSVGEHLLADTMVHECLQRMENMLLELLQASASQKELLFKLAGEGFEKDVDIDHLTANHDTDAPSTNNGTAKACVDLCAPMALVANEFHSLVPDVHTTPEFPHRAGVVPRVRPAPVDVDRKAINVIEQHKVQQAFDAFKHRASNSVPDPNSLVNRVISSAETISRQWSQIQEPHRRHILTRVAKSHCFEVACQCAIILNSVLVAVASDWQIRHVGGEQPRALEVVEYVFMIYFLLELFVRLGAHRCYFFLNEDMGWNIFDSILVSISMIDFMLSRLFAGAEGNSNFGFMRLVRFLKLARIFRSLRLFRLFRALNVLLESFHSSLNSLFWGLVMLAFVLYLFALIFINALVGYLDSKDDDIHPDELDLIRRKFGGLGLTVLSLYQSVTGGEDWSLFSDIIWLTGRGYGMLFVFYTFFTTFAVFNLVTGMIVEKAMSSAKPDRTDMILGQRKRIAEQKREFMDICCTMDTDKDGKITWSEFQEWMSNPVMVAYMASIGIDIHDVELFFSTVGARQDHGHLNPGEITYEHFVDGCMHMKGSATAIDMQRQLFEMHLLHLDLENFSTAFDKRMHSLERMLLQSSRVIRRASQASLKHTNLSL